MGDGIEGFERAFGAAGQIDDDGFVADGGDTTRKDSGWRFLSAFAANLFGEAGDDTVGEFERSFRRDVAGAEAGASGGEENVDASGVGDGAHLIAKSGRVVGGEERGGDCPSQFSATGNQCGAGAVIAFAAGDGIADGENGDAHKEV